MEHGQCDRHKVLATHFQQHCQLGTYLSALLYRCQDEERSQDGFGEMFQSVKY